MKKSSIIFGTLILTGASLIEKVIGFGFRIYISNVLGAEGMGLYSLVISIYMLLATIASAGVSISVSKLTAEAFAKNDYNAARRILKISCTVMGTIGVLAGALMFLLSDFCGNSILKDPRTILSLRILAPGLPFLSVSSCITGYFYATRSSLKPAVAQISEQLVKIFAVLLIFYLSSGSSLEYACAVAVAGITASDIFICLLQVAMYKTERKNTKKSPAPMKRIASKLFSMAVPVAANSYINSGLRLFENLLIPQTLKKSGMTSSGALGSYGMLKGMVLPVLTFPSAFLSALAGILVPTVAGTKVSSGVDRMRDSLSRVIHYTILLGIIIVSVFVTFSYDIGIILYGSRESGEMLRALSFICPFIYTEMVTVAILNGLGHQLTPLRVNLLDSSVRISIIYFLIPFIGFKGYILAIGVSSILSCSLYVAKLTEVTKLKFRVVKWVIKPTLAATAASLLVRLMLKIPLMYTLPKWATLPVGIIAVLLVYFILILLLGSFTFKDIKWIKNSVLGK